MVTALVVLSVLALGAWMVVASIVARGSRRIRVLAEALAESESRGAGGAAASRDQAAGLPSLSVVVTARDEAGQIALTVGHLLEQRYPRLEIIVVDDRSSDGTSEILDRLAAGAADPSRRLVIIHNRDLPEGWLGKCHACHLGAQRAGGDWILFTDGDVSLVDRDLLARTVRYAESRGLDHVGVLPDMHPMSHLQAGLVAAFGQFFVAGSLAHEMERDRPRGGGGVGAFNLVRRSAYERVKGHRLLRMELADDFKLGRLLKESGARQRLFSGFGLIRCPWHRGARNVIRGLEKNFFSAFDFSLGWLLLWTLAVLVLIGGPALGATMVTWLTWGRGDTALMLAAWIPALLQAALALLLFLGEAPRHGYRTLVLWGLYPLSVALLIAAAWNSAIRTLARGGVVWRGTFYSLTSLRRGLVPMGEGRRFLSPPA